MDNTLGDFLSEEPLPENTEAVVEEPVVEAETEQETAARERDERGRFKAREETGVETQEPVPPTEPTDRLPQAEYAALKDERRKRQELEDRLRQYEQHFAQQQAQPQAPQEAPDMFEDPAGFAAHLRQQILQELQPALQGAGTVTHAKLCERLARQQHQDYDDTVEVFKEELAQNPYLMRELQQSDDPAMYAYNVGKQVLAARSYGTEAPPSREQIEAEMRERIIAELNLPQSKAPSTFAGDRSVGSRSGPAWTGPTSMGDLLR